MHDLFDDIMQTLGSNGRAALQSLSLNLSLKTGRIPRNLDQRTLGGLRLKSLCIENLPLLDPSSKSQWRSIVIDILRNSPKLQYLKLSAIINKTYNNDVQTIFLDLCKAYKDGGGEPLRLKVLNLGEGMLLISDTVGFHVTQPTYLDWLMDASYLEELHISSVWQSTRLIVPLAWGTISPWSSPKLRRLRIAYLDRVGYRYLSVGSTTWPMADFLRSMDIHVEKVGYFGSSRLAPLPPGRSLAAELDPADLFSSLRRTLNPACLSLGSMALGTGVIPLLPRPWHHLRTLAVTVTEAQLAGLGYICATCTGSLEALSVRVTVASPQATPGRVGSLAQRVATYVAAKCASLRYIKFRCCCERWPRDLCMVWRSVWTGYWCSPRGMKRMGVIVPLRCGDDMVEEPRAFWSETRTMLHLADVRLD